MPPVTLEIKRNRFKANIFEFVIAVMVFMSLTNYIITFFEGINNADDPFQQYYVNNGIQIIFLLAVTSRIFFITAFCLLSLKTNKQRVFTCVYLSSAMMIGCLLWFELYYGSTFYYGEVRDKQGLMFPILASFMFTLVVLKVKTPFRESREFLLKLILSVLINAALYGLALYFFDSWGLSG